MTLVTIRVTIRLRESALAMIEIGRLRLQRHRGATAFLCLFDGTRRLCAYGLHTKAVLMTVLAAGICALYGGFAYWKYST